MSRLGDMYKQKVGTRSSLYNDVQEWLRMRGHYRS